MLISLSNQLTQTQSIQQTYLGGTLSPGATSAGIKNPAGFNNQWAVQLGQTGEENAEILILSGAPSGTTMNFGTSSGNTAGTVLYGHNLDTPIYQIHYDQIIFYRSTTGSTGPFSALATVSITPDNLYTNYEDTSGAASYAYYAQYYNSVNGDLSGSSSIFVPGGPTYYSLQKLRGRIKDKLYSAGYIRDDTVITDWVNEWAEIMQNSAVKVNQAYMVGSAQYTYGTNGLGTITDPSYKQMLKIEVIATDGTSLLPSQEIGLYDFSEQDYFDPYFPRHAWRGDNVVEILPHQLSGTFNATYAVRFTPLVNDSDELNLTLKAYTTSCIEYCLSVAYGLDQKDAESQQHFQVFNAMKADFVSEVTPRDQTGIKMIAMTDTVSAIAEDITNELGAIVW